MEQLRAVEGEQGHGGQAGGAANQEDNSDSHQEDASELFEKVRAGHFPGGIAHLVDAGLYVASDFIGRSAVSLHGPAVLGRAGCRHGYPKDTV